MCRCCGPRPTPPATARALGEPTSNGGRWAARSARASRERPSCSGRSRTPSEPATRARTKPARKPGRSSCATTCVQCGPGGRVRGTLPADTAPELPPVRASPMPRRSSPLTGLDIRHGGNGAFYMPRPGPDADAAFRRLRERGGLLLGALAHEATHWAGGKSRLRPRPERPVRIGGLRGRGTDGRAWRRLPCALAGAFQRTPPGSRRLCGQSWLQVLKGDKRAIFTAAAKAQKPPIGCTSASRSPPGWPPDQTGPCPLDGRSRATVRRQDARRSLTRSRRGLVRPVDPV